MVDEKVIYEDTLAMTADDLLRANGSVPKMPPKPDCMEMEKQMLGISYEEYVAAMERIHKWQFDAIYERLKQINDAARERMICCESPIIVGFGNRKE